MWNCTWLARTTENSRYRHGDEPERRPDLTDAANRPANFALIPVFGQRTRNKKKNLGIAALEMR